MNEIDELFAQLDKKEQLFQYIKKQMESNNYTSNDEVINTWWHSCLSDAERRKTFDIILAYIDKKG